MVSGAAVILPTESKLLPKQEALVWAECDQQCPHSLRKQGGPF